MGSDGQAPTCTIRERERERERRGEAQRPVRLFGLTVKETIVNQKMSVLFISFLVCFLFFLESESPVSLPPPLSAGPRRPARLVYRASCVCVFVCFFVCVRAHPRCSLQSLPRGLLEVPRGLQNRVPVLQLLPPQDRCAQLLLRVRRP